VSDSAGDPGGRRPVWAPPLTWLPKSLLEPSNAFRSIGVGWLLAFPASILLAALVHWIAPDAKTPDFEISGLAAIGMLVLFSPIVETLIMGGMLLVLLKFLSPTRAVIASAIAWGVAHSIAAPIWGPIIWWPFLIFSTLFVAWRGRSLLLAFVMPASVHGLQNLLPALLVATGRAG
jgi:hypothetical protein